MTKYIFLFILFISTISQSVYSYYNNVYPTVDSNTQQIIDTSRQLDLQRQMQKSANEIADAVTESNRQQYYPPSPAQSFMNGYNQAKRGY